MRCKACDRVLSDFESTRKYTAKNKNKKQDAHTYLDLCNACCGTIEDQIVTEVNHSLEGALEVEEDTPDEDME